MKKLLFLFLLTFTTISYSQTTLANKLKITANITDNTASKVNVQDATGLINTIPKLDLIDVLEYASAINLPITGVSSKIYVTIDNKKLYRWNGTFYQELAGSDINYQSIIDALTFTPENVANKVTSIGSSANDTNYPSELAVKTYADNLVVGLALKANLASPSFTGTPTAPTATPGTNTEQIATTAFVQAFDTNVVHNTGAESVGGVKTFTSTPKFSTAAISINNSDNDGYGNILLNVNRFIFKDKTNAAQFLTQSAGFASYKSPSILANFINTNLTATRSYSLPDISGTLALINDTALAGTPTAPTATAGTNTTQIATTAFVAGGLATKENAFTKNTAFNKNFGTTVGTVVEGGTLGSSAYINADISSTANTVVQRTNDGLDMIKAGYFEMNRVGVDATGMSDFVTTNGGPVLRRNSIGAVQIALGLGSNAYSSTAYLPLTGGNLNGKLTLSADADNEQFLIKRASTPNSQLIIGYHSGGYGRIQAVEQGVGYRPIVLNSDGGNVLIGTTTDNGVNKLQVNGSGKFSTGVNVGDSESYSFGGASVKVIGNAGANVMDIQTNNTSALFLSATQVPRFTALAGTGTRNVVADASGNLSTDSTVYAPLASPALTGTPTAPTATVGTNTTQIATTAFVQANSSARPYKVYTALLTQTGTNAPVATVLENTLGGTVVWTRTSLGTYTGTLAGAFTLNKVGILFGSKTSPNHIVAISSDVNTITIFTNNSSGALTEGVLQTTTFEIKVYN